jgi:hypothetical protein
MIEWRKTGIESSSIIGMRLEFDHRGTTPRRGGRMRRKSRVAVVLILAALTPLPASVARADQGEEAEQIEAIFSKTSNGYVRLLRPDGSLRPETYRYGKGEFWGGDFVDSSVDRLTVDDIARTISPALARRSYVAAKDPSFAELFIVISWGTTVAPEHRTMDPAYEDVERGQMRANTKPHSPFFGKAGYTVVMSGVTGGLQEGALDGSANTWNLGGADPSSAIVPTRSTSDANANDNVIIQASSALRVENQMWAQISQENARMLGYASLADAELQRYRYFVVLQAYDNRTLSQKKPKLLWEARLSISEHRNLFDKRLGALAENASAYFGQDGNGLVHKAVPVGFVRIGQMSSLEFPTEPEAAALAGDGAHVAYLRRERSETGLAVVDVDKPEETVFAKIPGGAEPARIAWSDPEHIRVTLVSAGAATFDTRSLSWSAAPADSAPAGHPTAARDDAMLARVEGKFPHRNVEILGSDNRGRRYLLAVSGTKGPARYYLFDNEDDVLVDVGRSSRAP